MTFVTLGLERRQISPVNPKPMPAVVHLRWDRYNPTLRRKLQGCNAGHSKVTGAKQVVIEEALVTLGGSRWPLAWFYAKSQLGCVEFG